MLHLQIRCLQKLSENSVSTVTTHSSQSNLDHDTCQAFLLHWEQNPDSLPEPCGHPGYPYCCHADAFQVSDHQALHHLSFYQQWTENMRPPFFMSLAPSLSPNFGLNVMSLNSADLMRWFICPFLICLPYQTLKSVSTGTHVMSPPATGSDTKKHLASVSWGKTGTSSPAQNFSSRKLEKEKKIQGDI